MKDYYQNILRKEIILRANCNNLSHIPEVQKIILHTGVKKATHNKKELLPVLLGLEILTGQKAFVTKAKKPIAAFKLKKGMPLGCKITLLNINMYNFLDKLIDIVLPSQKKMEKFNSSSFDCKANLTLGLKSLSWFDEIGMLYDLLKIKGGCQITMITSGSSNLEGKIIFNSLLLPLS